MPTVTRNRAVGSACRNAPCLRGIFHAEIHLYGARMHCSRGAMRFTGHRTAVIAAKPASCCGGAEKAETRQGCEAAGTKCDARGGRGRRVSAARDRHRYTGAGHAAFGHGGVRSRAGSRASRSQRRAVPAEQRRARRERLSERRRRRFAGCQWLGGRPAVDESQRHAHHGGLPEPYEPDFIVRGSKRNRQRGDHERNGAGQQGRRQYRRHDFGAKPASKLCGCARRAV